MHMFDFIFLSKAENNNKWRPTIHCVKSTIKQLLEWRTWDHVAQGCFHHSRHCEDCTEVNVIYYKYISYLGESRDYFQRLFWWDMPINKTLRQRHFCQENTYCLRNLKQTFQDWRSDKSCQISSLGTLNEVRWTDDREDSCASLTRGTCCLDLEMESELTYCCGPGVSPHLVISGNSRLWPGFESFRGPLQAGRGFLFCQILS